MIGENKMKKFLAIVLAIIFVFCLTACNKDETPSDVKSNTTSNISQTTSMENQTNNTVVTTESELTESTKPSDLNNPTTVSNITEEQVRKIVKEEISKIEKPSTSGNNLTEEQVRKIVKEEIAAKDKFVPGEELKCTVGKSFKIFIVRTSNIEKDSANIEEISITNYKQADINNIDDYINKNGFYKYLYKGNVKGKVDKKFAGEKFELRINGEGLVCPNSTGATVINADGTFSYSFIAYSNIIVKEYTPYHAYIPGRY